MHNLGWLSARSFANCWSISCFREVSGAFKVTEDFTFFRFLLLLSSFFLSFFSYERKIWKLSVTRYFASGFFHESSSPKPPKITSGSFQIFSKIRRDIQMRKGALPVSMKPVANLLCVKDTGGKFVNYTGGYFATCIIDTGGKFCHRYRSVVLFNFFLNSYDICPLL